MKSLILDCSCGMSVYLVIDENVFSKVDRTQNKHTDEILKTIDELFSDAKIDVKQIDNICVCVGPGSFTGVRVAISIAKGLAIGTGAKVFTLTNFDVYDVKNDKNFYLILDGFSNFVYSRKCENGIVMDECVDFDELVLDIKNKQFNVYVQTEKTQNRFKKSEIQSNFANLDIISAFNKKIQSNKFVKLNQIYPVYLRASQAEIERLKKM